MSKVEKCTECGATRIVKNDLCKRCRKEVKLVSGAAE